MTEAWKNPSEREQIENIRPKTDYKYYHILYQVLVSSIGLELAKKWFYSEVDDQKKAVIYWSMDNLSMWSEFDQGLKEAIVDEYNFFYYFDKKMNVCIWNDLNNTMKNKMLTRLFDEYPGKSFVSTHMPFAPSRYVLDPKVDHLRNIIKEAGDAEYFGLFYMAKICEMISQREKAYEDMVSQTQQRIRYNPNENERELIARLMEITSRSGYLPAALPPIFVSSETPPIFVSYPELEEEDNRAGNRDERGEDRIPRNRERSQPETVSIEELLGVYQPQHEQIIIYEKGIRWRGHRLDEEWLFAVVLIHEIGHWITHILPKPNIPAWKTDLYIQGEADVKEGWAQLMTYWIANQVGGKFKRTFEELNKNQSPPYRVFEQFKDEPIDKVMASLEKLRLLSWPSRLQDWRKAIDQSNS